MGLTLTIKIKLPYLLLDFTAHMYHKLCSESRMNQTHAHTQPFSNMLCIALISEKV